MKKQKIPGLLMFRARTEWHNFFHIYWQHHVKSLVEIQGKESTMDMNPGRCSSWGLQTQYTAQILNGLISGESRF